MSTRVFKPISVSEISKMRSSPMLEGRLAFKGVQKVRRALFHPDAQETKRFLKEEFAKMTAYECEKWDFDFIKGRPKQTMGGYEWTLITDRPKLDVMMTPIKRFIDIQDISEDYYPPIQSSSESSIIEDAEMSTSEDVNLARGVQKKQRLITDFMYVRKRIEERPLKKMAGTSSSRPQKKARMSYVDSAS